MFIAKHVVGNISIKDRREIKMVFKIDGGAAPIAAYAIMGWISEVVFAAPQDSAKQRLLF